MLENKPAGPAGAQIMAPTIPSSLGLAPVRAIPSLSITLPPGMTAAVESLITETGKPLGEIVAGALGLYVLTLKAHQEGKAVGVATSPDALETEFVGF